MRKIIGIGETILDIIFRNDQPSAAVPGGSVFNAIVTLARLGADVRFISETGEDHVGNMIRNYMCDNNISTDYLDIYPESKSPVSLAFLNDGCDAQYSFYKAYPEQRLDVKLPTVEKDDIVMIGSYYAVTPALRDKHLELLNAAREAEAIVFYDLNFRYPHKNEAIRLSPYILENLEYATIVRGSEDDFSCLYNITGADKVYRDKIKFYCPNFIYTAGGKDVSLLTRAIRKDYPVSKIEPVSTVGAGDNFNAGIIFSLLKKGIGYDGLGTTSEQEWDEIIGNACTLASEVCMHYDNSISKAFAESVKGKLL